MDKRKELLRLKLVTNQQRLFRQDYLADLPERLGTYLEGRPYVQSPELDEITPLFYVLPEGIARSRVDIQHRNFFKPEGYVYREFSWLNQLFEAALSVGSEHDQEEAFFYPFEGPLYQVPFGWVRKNVVELFSCKSRMSYEVKSRKYCPERVGVVTIDFKIGLVLDNYAGYLAEDPNPDETVYQLATWGFR